MGAQENLRSAGRSEERESLAHPANAASLTPAHPWVLGTQQVIRFGIGGGPFAGEWPILRDFVQTVEGLGFDWRPDHPVRPGWPGHPDGRGSEHE